MEKPADCNSDSLRQMRGKWCSQWSSIQCSWFLSPFLKKLIIIIGSICQRNRHFILNLCISLSHQNISFFVHAISKQYLIRIIICCCYMTVLIRCRIGWKKYNIHTSHKESQHKKIPLHSLFFSHDQKPKCDKRKTQNYAQTCIYIL